MALAVCLLFDRRTERRLVHLWQAIEAAGIASLPSHTHGRHVPHLSYAVLRTFDVEAVRAALGTWRRWPTTCCPSTGWPTASPWSTAPAAGGGSSTGSCDPHLTYGVLVTTTGGGRRARG